jgi:hypothetical protein
LASIIKVDTIQTAAGGTPTAADLGINTSGTVLNAAIINVTPSSSVSVTSNTYTNMFNTNYSPVSNNSTILIRLAFDLRTSRSGSNESRFFYRILLNSTEAFEVREAGAYDYGGGGIWLHTTYTSDCEFTNTTGNTLNIIGQVHTDNRAESVAHYEPPYGRSTIQILEIAG